MSPVFRPQSRKQWVFVAALVAFFLTGFVDGIAPLLIDRFIIAYLVIPTFLGLYWIYLDAHDLDKTRPAITAIIFCLLLVPLGLLVHLLSNRSVGQAMRAFALTAVGVVAAYALGSLAASLAV